MRRSIFTAIPLATLAAALAGCSARDIPTAPLPDAIALNPAGFIGDRPYTWTLKCSGDLGASASWSWTASGVTIAGTTVSANCFPGSSPISGSGTRPAAADGLSACVNGDGIYNGACKTWTFDPATGFKAQLKGTATYPNFDPNCFDPFGHTPGSCKLTAVGTLNVDS